MMLTLLTIRFINPFHKKLNIMAKSASKTRRPARKSPSASSNGKSNGSTSRRKQKSVDELHHGEDNEDLMKLFEHALKDMYWVEKTLTRAIPKMIKKATAPKLTTALIEHLEETERQVTKLEKVFKAIDKAPRAKKCIGMDGILMEGEELMKEFTGPTLDEAIIMAALKVEHYEMSAYISMITLADTLNLVKEADILQEILDEEMKADRLLTSLGVVSAHEIVMEERE